jgi:hypothetical protein
MPCARVLGLASLHQQTSSACDFARATTREGVAPMTITDTTSTAALPARARSMPISPSPLFAAVDASWRESAANSARMRNASAPTSGNHNSIAPTTGAVPATAGRVAYGAAKQAAPPRGVPR